MPISLGDPMLVLSAILLALFIKDTGSMNRYYLFTLVAVWSTLSA